MLNTFCSFCGRSSREVKKMIRSPAGASVAVRQMRSPAGASVGGATRRQIGGVRAAVWGR
jgi:hypothetical protein